MNDANIPPPITVTISTKGQIAIPKEIRLATGLEAGTRVVLICHENGSMELRPIKHSISELFGVAKKYIRKDSLKTAYSEDRSIMQQVLKEDDATKSKSKSKSKSK